MLRSPFFSPCRRAFALVSSLGLASTFSVACSDAGQADVAKLPTSTPATTVVSDETGGSNGDAGTSAADSGSASDASAPVIPVNCPAPPTADIALRLACVSGTTIAEYIDDPAAETKRVPEGYRRFDMTFEQPVDHVNPENKTTFRQRLSVLHKDTAAPLVLASSGYGLSTGRSELTRLFASNQIQVEHRYFTPSAPTPVTWEHLTIAQSAADYHAITVAFKTIYGAKWVNTGGSKGGMTSVFHRRFYPTDVDATVAYVAPITYGVNDPRFDQFLKKVGGPAYDGCRQKITEVQKAVLLRRDELTPFMTEPYDRLGGKDVAIEHAVLEFPFVFWQYTNPDNKDQGCAALPTGKEPAQSLFEFFASASQLSNYSDFAFDYFLPYFYQSATQLGGPSIDDTELAALLRHRATYTLASYAPKGVSLAFDDNAMIDIQSWVKTGGSSLMFLYGEYDPWTAGAFELGAARDSFSFTAPKRNHGARLATLADADQTAAIGTLERWLEAKVVPPPQPTPGSRVFQDSDDETPRFRPRR